MAQIHWFPGHMKKGLNEVTDKIKMMDVIIELFDARAPKSSINEQLDKSIQGKKTLIVLTKPDLADLKQTELWKKELSKKYDSLLVLDLTNPNSTNIIANAVVKLGEAKWAKQKAKGMKPQPIRAMILGVPNVGKSSLINRLAKRKAAGVQNKPGYTRGEQWINVNKDFLLLDTPGILPMSYDNQEKASNLALLGSIREDILPKTELVQYFLKLLNAKYPDSLIERFGIETIGDYETVMNAICESRKLLDSVGNNDFQKAENVLLKEFKDGLLGKITLEWL